MQTKDSLVPAAEGQGFATELENLSPHFQTCRTVALRPERLGGLESPHQVFHIPGREGVVNKAHFTIQEKDMQQ
jgi:hypothetical protein